MKAKFIAAFLFCSIVPSANAGWVEQTGFDSEFYPRSVFFLDANTGWIVGANQGLDGTGPNTQQIYHTTDGGDTWGTMLAPGDQEGGASSISQLFGLHFHDANNGWVAGRSGPPSTTLQVRATANGGTSWSKVNIPGGGDTLFDIHATSATDVWAVGNRTTVLHSTDGFQTYTEQTVPGLLSSQIWNIDMPSSTTGYIADPNYGQIFKTTDGGTNWQLIHTVGALTVSMDFIDENTGWVGGDGSTLLKTTDGGSSWVPQVIPTSNSLSQIASVSFFDSMHGTLLMKGTQAEIWGTADGGATWELQHILGNVFSAAVFMSGTDSAWFAGDGVLSSQSITQELGLDSQSLFLSSASSSGIVLKFDPNAPVNFLEGGVPEPSSLAILSCLMCFSVARHRRRGLTQKPPISNNTN